MEQLQENARHMQSELQARFRQHRDRHGLPDLKLAWCSMLAFPLTRVDDHWILPTGMPRQAVIDADDLETLDAKIEAWMRSAVKAHGHTTLTPQQWDKLLRAVLMPELSLVPNLGGKLARRRSLLVRLDDRQRLIMECLVDNDRFAVRGAAGTGKSMLALEAARRWAQAQGRRVLLLCFNRALAFRLQEHAAAFCLEQGGVDVRHFHGLLADVRGAMSLPLTPPEGSDADAARVWWEEEAPRALEQAWNDGTLPQWDALVVDEGQDFHRDWWALVQLLMPQLDEGPLVVVYDPEQILFGRPVEMPPLFTLRLFENYRNPRAVAQELALQTSEPIRSHPDVEEMGGVHLHDALSPAKLTRRLEELVARYLREALAWSDLIILGPHRLARSPLAGCVEIAGLPLTEDLNAAGPCLRYATISSYKGLESPVVFLVDADSDKPRMDRHARYVATSRATMALHIFPSGAGWVRGELT